MPESATQMFLVLLRNGYLSSKFYPKFFLMKGLPDLVLKVTPHHFTTMYQSKLNEVKRLKRLDCKLVSNAFAALQHLVYEQP